MGRDGPSIELPAGELIPLGVISRPLGLKGEVYVHLHNPSSTALFDRETLILQQGRQRFEVPLRQWRHQGGKLVVALKGYDDRNAAESLRGATVMLARRDLPPPELDEFYDLDLLGLTVLTTTSDLLGTVIAVDHPPANDVVIIKLQEGTYVDLPLIASLVKEVDISTRIMTIELPEGLPKRDRR